MDNSLSPAEFEELKEKIARAMAVSLGREHPNADDFTFAHKFLAAFGAIRKVAGIKAPEEQAAKVVQ